MDPKELEVQLHDLETRIERLKALYEQYFQGLERIEPQVARKEVDRKIALLRKEQIRSSTTRFKFQSIQQRYTSYQTLWGRITRQIEEGTYRRDVMKLRQQRAKKVDPRRSSRPPEWQLGVDFEDTDDFFKNLGFDDANVRGDARVSRPPPPMATPQVVTPAAMSFARPKELTQSQSRLAVPAQRPASVPPRGMPVTSMPSLGMPRVPSMGSQSTAPSAPSLGAPRVPTVAPAPGGIPRAPAPRAPAPRAPSSIAAPAVTRPVNTMPPSIARPPVPTIAPRPVNTMVPRAPTPIASPAMPRPVTIAPRPPMSATQSPPPLAPKPIAPPRAPVPPKKSDT